MITPMRWAAVALLSSTAVPLLSPAPTQAVVITVGSAFYDVSIVDTSYDNATSVFSGLPPLGRMPWWGDANLAYDFALQVYSQLGDGSTVGYGPVFAHQMTAAQVLGILQNSNDPLDAIDVALAANATVKYAVAAPFSPLPVPGPLPLLGAAAGFHWSRQLRRRNGRP